MLVKLYVVFFSNIEFEQSSKTCYMPVYFDQQVAILSECSEDMVDIAFQYGRNIGIAFQVRMIFYFRATLPRTTNLKHT